MATIVAPKLEIIEIDSQLLQKLLIYTPFINSNFFIKIFVMCWSRAILLRTLCETFIFFPLYKTYILFLTTSPKRQHAKKKSNQKRESLSFTLIDPIID